MSTYIYIARKYELYLFFFSDFRPLSCRYIRYTGDWDSDLAKEDVGIDSDVYFTQSFVAKMR